MQLSAGCPLVQVPQITPQIASRRAKRQCRRGQATQASSSRAVLQEAAPTSPGEVALYHALTALAGFEPFLWLLRRAAFVVIERTAEQRGVQWRHAVQELKNNPEVYQLKDELTDPDVELAYPAYYLKAFHGYTRGNLDWKAAFEAEPATEVIAARLYNDPSLNPAESALKERRAYIAAIREYLGEQQQQVRHILDVGCGVGISTRALAEEDASLGAEIIGLDLSPYFLAVAELRNRQQQQQQAGSTASISYRHGLGERTGLPTDSQDLVVCGFTYHELPAEAAAAVAAEARRVCRPGGVFTVIDLSPKSGVYKEKNPLAVLRNIVEPWHDAYFATDLQDVLEQAGFTDVTTVVVSPRHHAVMGRAL